MREQKSASLITPRRVMRSPPSSKNTLKHTQAHSNTDGACANERVKLRASGVHSSTAPFCVSAKRDLGRTRAHQVVASGTQTFVVQPACFCVSVRVCVCGTYPSQCQPKGDAACEDPTPHLHLAHTATGERTKAQRLVPLRRPSCPTHTFSLSETFSLKLAIIC